MQDPATLAIVAATFLLAGLVKGVIGLGLPTIGLALLTAALGLPQAMALLLAPSLVTNLWQAAAGGHGLLTTELGLVSGAVVLPAVLCMALGRRVRQRLQEHRFRQVFFLALLALGAWLALGPLA